MKTLRQLVQETIQYLVNEVGGDTIEAYDVYLEITDTDADVEVSKHPIYGDDTLSFNAIRNTVHNLYKEGWFAATKEMPYGRIQYSDIHFDPVEDDKTSEFHTEREYKSYLSNNRNKANTDPKPYAGSYVVDDNHSNDDCDLDRHVNDYPSDVESDERIIEDDDDHVRNYIDFSDLIFLVLEVLQEFKVESREFSAYDVTEQVRINNPSYEIIHEDVKSIVVELFNKGLFYDDYSSQYVRKNGKRYIEYQKIESSW